MLDLVFYGALGVAMAKYGFSEFTKISINFTKFFCHFRLVASIENNRRSELKRAKQRARAKVRSSLLSRLQKQKGLGAHKALMEASNQKILARIEQLKIQRKRAQEFKQKEAIRQQLQKVGSLCFYLF